MKTTIEKIVVRFTADMSEWNNAVKQVEKQTNALQRKLGSVGRSLTKNVTLPLAGIGGLAIREFAKMDQAITQSASIMSKDVQRMGFDNLKNQLTETANAVSRDMPIATEKLAESFYFLASAGFDAKESMAAMPLMARFATAGMFDMATATDLVTDAQSALGKNTGTVEERMIEMERLASNLVEANTLANASVEQFSTALTSKAATAMKIFNIEQEHGIAVLAAYADQGIKAELAGNSYDRVLRLLVKSAQANSEAHKAFGLDVFDTNGAMNSMVVIAKQLEDGLAGMTKEQQAATLATLGFEARVQQAIFPLIGASEQIAEYEKNLRDMKGTVDEVANRQLTSFINQVKLTWNSIKVVAADIGRLLIPSVLHLMETIRDLSDVWLALDDATKRNIISFGKLAAAAGPVLLILTNMLVVLPSVIAGYKLLTTAAFGTSSAFGILKLAILSVRTALFSVPIAGWIAAAITGIAILVVKFDLIKKTVDLFGGTWAEVWNNIKIVTQNAITNVIILFNGLWDSFGITLGYFAKHGPAILKETAVELVHALKPLADGFMKMLSKLYAAFSRVLLEMTRMAVKFAASFSKVLMQLASDGVRIMSALTRLDFDEAMAIARKSAARAAAPMLKSMADAYAKGKKVVTDVAKDLGEDFMKNFNEGMSTGRGDLLGTLASQFDFVDPLSGTTIGANGGGTNGDFFEVPAVENPNLYAQNPWDLPLSDSPEDGLPAVEEAKKKIAEPIVIPVTFGVDAASAYSTEAFLMQYNQRMQKQDMVLRDKGGNKRTVKQNQLAERRDLQRQAREDREHREQMNEDLIQELRTLGEGLIGLLTGANIGGTS